MNISSAKATFGLNARVTPTNGATSGAVQVGLNNVTLPLNDVDVIHSFEALLVQNASELNVDVSDISNDDSTAWTAGVRQVETATAAGTITTAGLAEVTVTAAGMPNSPKTIEVGVALNDTAATWAGKVRAALAADVDVSAMFDVSGTTTAIVLTRKPQQTYTIKSAPVEVRAANDGTLNIALDNGTCAGITPAASSANTTAGVATSGVYAPDLTGSDVFGESLTVGGPAFICITNDANSDGFINLVSLAFDAQVERPGSFLLANATIQDFAVTPESIAKVTITIAGNTTV